MADVRKVKVGSSDAQVLMFDRYVETVSNSKFDFSTWTVEDGVGDIVVTQHKVTIKKFKPNVMLMHSEAITGTPNTAICAACAGMVLSIEGLTANSSVFSTYKTLTNNHGAGSDLPKAMGLCFYPGEINEGVGYLMMERMYTWEKCWSDADTQDLHPVAEWSAFRHGSGQGQYGWTSDQSNVVNIPANLYDFNAWSRKYGYSPVTWYMMFGLYTGNEDVVGDDGLVDVSDNPIVITEGEVYTDPTSVECWDAFCGDTQLYHKDKTLENCWKKYGLAFPKDWRLVRTNFDASDYVEWVSPTRFRIKSVPSGGVTISVADDGNTSDSDNKSNYVKINWKQFVVKLHKALPAGVTVKIVRGLGNAYYDYDNVTGVYSNPVSDIETVLSVGENTIAALDTEIHKKSSDATMSFNECRIVISSSAAVADVDCYVEIVPPFADGEVLTVNASHWNLDKVKVPTITDLEEHIDKIQFNVNPANADFWTPIKEYYKTNVFAGDAVPLKFYNAKNLDELELTLPNAGWLSYNHTFKSSSIKKLTLTGQENTFITSLNGIFEGIGNLTELVVNVDDEHDGDYLAGANDCSNMFNWCGLPTYPSNFIRWNKFRTNAAAFSKNATMAHSMFWNAAIETVPNYGTNADADANTILCGSASGMFYKCDDLVTVGPIVDLQLIKPTGGENIFVDCTKLTTIRIKNLNHGNWHFDNTEFESGKKHGTLKALDASSIQYLFSNLADLNNHDANKNVSTINNDFTKWSSAYTTHGVYSSDYDYKFASASSLVLKKRFASQAEASFIVSTTSSAIDISFTVKGLADGDSLLFGAGGSSAADYTITEDGTYTVKKTDTLRKGFMLVNSDTSVESNVTVTLNKGWDLSVPSVSTAELHCPAEWGGAGFDFSTMNNNNADSITSSKVVLNKRLATSDSTACVFITTANELTLNIVVSGLIDGDILGVGNGDYGTIQNKITSNGEHKIVFEANTTWGFKLWNNTSTDDTSSVTISSKGVNKITDDMVTAANAKGWSVYIGGTIKEVS